MFGAKPSPPADITVQEGDRISVGNIVFQVIATPGHSPGSMCLLGEGLVFTGDTLFVGAIGRTDLPGGSWSTMARSLRDKLSVLPDETRVLPGHNYGAAPTSTIGYEKRHNPYLKF
jgi:glyoxylase-like metal-dependent hydrolase (beta-lactamase superfamily II)